MSGRAGMARRALSAASSHPVATASAVLALALAALLVPTGQAHAAGLLSVVFGDDVMNGIANPLNDIVAGWLRDGINTLLEVAAENMDGVVAGSGLAAPFDELIASAYPTVHAIHTSIAIPLANVVLLVFLVAGLASAASRMGSAEVGIDMWRFIGVFIAYAFMKAIIDSSWELMMLVYQAISSLVPRIGASGAMAASFTGVPEEINNIGVLLTTLVVVLIVFVIELVCVVIVNVVVIVRSIQIYVYTAFGSIPLAFAVSEGSRHVASSFVRKYVAVVGSGLILALLFAMMGSVVGAFGSVSTVPVPGDPASMTLYMVELLRTPAVLVAFAFCAIRSGDWARDLVGF